MASADSGGRGPPLYHPSSGLERIQATPFIESSSAFEKNPKNPKSIVSYDYEVGLESEVCKIYIKNTGFEIALSTMAYDKTSVDGFTGKRSVNINYDYNSKLKIRQFATRLKALCLAP